jgi:Cd2+/Zn2+-exporting ATPase
MTHVTYRVQGLCCADEVAVLKRALATVIADESRLHFDLLNARLRVELAPGESPESIPKAIAPTGMTASQWRPGSELETDSRIIVARMHRLRAWSCGVSGAAICIAMVLQHAMTGSIVPLFAGESASVQWSVRILLVSAAIVGGLFALPKAWYAIRTLRADMNLLMLIAVCGAFALGEWFEAAMVAFLFGLALMLESWSVGRARHAVHALLELESPTARYRVVETGFTVEHEGPPEEVPVGATVLVRPGERVPLDGTVSEGITTVNQAPITGESMPIAKEPGDTVYAGTINHEGAFEFVSSKTAEDTTLANIVRLVEEAQSQRAPSEQWIDRFARYYTPAMIVLAIGVALVLPSATHYTWTAAIYQALVILLIACPCALVISTPVSIVSGLASAARAGVLIKGGAYLEAPAHIRAIAFDKTGTLTQGCPAVQVVEAVEGWSESDVLRIAAALEAQSNHPIAQAIVTHTQELNLDAESLTDFVERPGRGAEGTVGGEAYWIGNHRLAIEKDAFDSGIKSQTEALQNAGRTVVILGKEDSVCGLIGIADEPRDDSAKTVAAIRKLGVEHIEMLTGDNTTAATRLGETLGCDETHAELLPADKVARVQALNGTHTHVAMVGDGINDAPAMAASGLGIAMGAAGSDAAIEAADVALMSDDLSRIPWLIRHSRRTLSIIKQNVCWAIGLKISVLGLALLGQATLWMAVMADMGASLLVLFNALRLLRVPE